MCRHSLRLSAELFTGHHLSGATKKENSEFTSYKIISEAAALA